VWPGLQPDRPPARRPRRVRRLRRQVGGPPRRQPGGRQGAAARLPRQDRADSGVVSSQGTGGEGGWDPADGGRGGGDTPAAQLAAFMLERLAVGGSGSRQTSVVAAPEVWRLPLHPNATRASP